MVPQKVDTVWVPDAPEGELAYKGRVGVYETILTTKELEEAIRGGVSIREYEKVAHEQGICNMHEDAILKVLAGMTTLEEVYRILGDTYEPHV